MMWDLIKKNQVFLLVFLFFVLRKLLERVLGGVELDVVVLAKHYLNNSYIQNDWYLNLGISYRYLFNFFAGTLALFLPFCRVRFGRFPFGLSGMCHTVRPDMIMCRDGVQTPPAQAPM